MSYEGPGANMIRLSCVNGSNNPCERKQKNKKQAKPDMQQGELCGGNPSKRHSFLLLVLVQPHGSLPVSSFLLSTYLETTSETGGKHFWVFWAALNPTFGGQTDWSCRGSRILSTSENQVQGISSKASRLPSQLWSFCPKHNIWYPLGNACIISHVPWGTGAALQSSRFCLMPPVPYSLLQEVSVKKEELLSGTLSQTQRYHFSSVMQEKKSWTEIQLMGTWILKS